MLRKELRLAITAAGLVSSFIVLSACTRLAPAPTLPPVALPTATFQPRMPSPTVQAPATPAPSSTTAPTQVPPTATLVNPPSAAATGEPSGTLGDYIDDRSTAQSLMMSFVNALNRKEYVRAYSYWEPSAASAKLPPFAQFEQGYANTASVQLALGSIGAGAAAGNLYWSVPVALTAKTTGGATQTFVGCYTLHLGQPAVQGVPPFRPMGIQSAQVEQVANDANTGDLLARACQQPGTQQMPPVATQPTFAPTDIGAARYLDDRSGPLQIVRSYFNAVNRKEYVRAYSYWQPSAAASQLLPFPQFAQGYAETKSVELTTGTVKSDLGAGQIYYAVPLTLIAQTTTGATQTFVGCYRLHLSRPDIQGVPPFQPLAIESAGVNQVANDANTAQLMGQACQ